MLTGLILAIGLALIHAFASQFPIFSIVPRFRWLSFAGGVSLAYVFLEIFPELSHAQEELEHSEIPLIGYLENHVYILALLGIILFYSLERLALSARAAATKPEQSEENRSVTIFWMHIVLFVVLNGISGYLLQNMVAHTLFTGILFFVAIALHLFIIDENLREHYQNPYDNLGRWLLVAAIITGAILGRAVHLNESAIAIVWSFFAGVIILNVLNRELPDEKETCFLSFLGGTTLFTVLLLAQ